MPKQIEKSGAFTPKHTIRAFVASLDLKASSTSQYQFAASALDEYLGRPAKLSDLTEVVLSDFSEWLATVPGRSDSTKQNFRSHLSVIANHAAELEIIPPVLLDNATRGYTYEVGDNQSRWGLQRYFEDVYLIDRQTGDSPLTPETAKAYRAAVAAFLRYTPDPPTVHHINAAAVRAFRAWLVAGIPAASWWRLLHIVDWDTMGERTGALLDLRWEWLDWETGHLSIPAQYRKGGRKPNLCRLKPSTMRELHNFRLPERELIFPWELSHTAFYYHYKRLLRLAGLPYVRYKSAIQMHRRTFATHLEMIGGNATEALRHSERSITTDSYIDPKLLNRAPANEALFALGDIG